MKFNTSADDDSNFFIPQQFTEAFETKNVEGVRIILKKIEASDLSTIKALFMDPTTAGYLEGTLPQESDWQQGAKMYNKFCTWVQRSQEKELSWWIIKPKNSSEVLGALGLKQDKQDKVIELCVLMSSKCLQPESVASEAIWFSFWWYHNMDLVSKQYNLQECTVQIRSHINNLMCQRYGSICFVIIFFRLCMSFGLKTNNQIVFLDEKHPCLLYSARVMDIYNTHFLNHFPVFLQPQANPAPLLASELVVPMFQQQYYVPQQQQQQQILSQQLANLVSAMAGYQHQNQQMHQQQALLMNPQAASIPLATTKLEVKQQEVVVKLNESNQGMMNIEYAEGWTSKLLSSNAKKVEMASPAAAAKDYLPCLDTNQLTTIGTISVNDLHDEQDVTVRVQLLTHDGTMLLQANKSKRRKSAVSGEKLQHSVFHLDQDNTVEIRLQAGNVVKAGASRKRCYAKVELMNSKNQVIDSMNTIPFFVIAKLNYKSYQDKVVTEPKKEANTPAPTEQPQQVPQQPQTPAPMMMNSNAGFTAENAPIMPNPLFSNPQQTLHWLSQQQFPQHAQQNPTFLYDNQSFLTSLQAATLAAALWPNNANSATTLSTSALNVPVQATTAAIIPPSLLSEVMTLQQSLQIPLLAQQQIQMPVHLEPLEPMDDMYLQDHELPEASVPLDNLDAFFDAFSASEY